jgi:hypothetical protein
MSEPRSGVNWSVLTPQLLRPKPVERAVVEVERLRTLVGDEAAALAAASAALDEAEKADVQALAASFRSGATATPQTPKIEQARTAVREHERRVEAAREALAAAEVDVGVALQQARASWQTSAVKETERVRQECRDALASLRAELERLSALRGLDAWLQADMNEAKTMRARGLLHAPSSRTAQANGDPVGGDLLLQWTSELIDPPAKPEPPENRPLPGPTPVRHDDAAVAY